MVSSQEGRVQAIASHMYQVSRRGSVMVPGLVMSTLVFLSKHHRLSPESRAARNKPKSFRYMTILDSLFHQRILNAVSMSLGAGA